MQLNLFHWGHRCTLYQKKGISRQSIAGRNLKFELVVMCVCVHEMYEFHMNFLVQRNFPYMKTDIKINLEFQYISICCETCRNPNPNPFRHIRFHTQSFELRDQLAQSIKSIHICTRNIILTGMSLSALRSNCWRYTVGWFWMSRILWVTLFFSLSSCLQRFYTGAVVAILWNIWIYIFSSVLQAKRWTKNHGVILTTLFGGLSTTLSHLAFWSSFSLAFYKMVSLCVSTKN